MITQEQLDIYLSRFRCCASNLAYKLMKAEQYSAKDIQCLYCKLQILLNGIKTLERYNPLQGGDYSQDYSEDYNIKT